MALKDRVDRGPKETDEFVKSPDVTNVQYSVLLIPVSVPSKLPPEGPVNACTVAVVVPAPVVGFTKENGR